MTVTELRAALELCDDDASVGFKMCDHVSLEIDSVQRAADGSIDMVALGFSDDKCDCDRRHDIGTDE